MRFKDELEDCHFWNMVDSAKHLLDRLESFSNLLQADSEGIRYACGLFDTQIKPEIAKFSRNMEGLLDYRKDPVINATFTKEDKEALLKAMHKCNWSRWS